MKTQVIQIDENNQIRIRFNEWKGTTKVYIQNFFRPGPNSRFPTEQDGYAYGKAVAIPPDRWREFMEKAFAFTDQNQKYFPAPNKPKVKTKKPKLEAEEIL